MPILLKDLHGSVFTYNQIVEFKCDAQSNSCDLESLENIAEEADDDKEESQSTTDMTSKSQSSETSQDESTLSKDELDNLIDKFESNQREPNQEQGEMVLKLSQVDEHGLFSMNSNF